MSYHRYLTEALVLSSFPSGESNRCYFLFTRELGMVLACAQGARELHSKLRSNLRELSRASVELVRGRERWRLVSASGGNDLLPQSVIAKLESLLRRLMQGDGEHRALFDSISESIHFYLNENLSPEEMDDFEVFLAAKVLFHLGYWKNALLRDDVILGKTSREALASIKLSRGEIIKAVNSSLAESHL